MKTIWKFELQTSDNQRVGMPVGAEILTVQTQKGILCLWALVDPEAPKETRRFEIYGIGDPIRCENGIKRNYINTYQLHNGGLDFHVFEYIGS